MQNRFPHRIIFPDHFANEKGTVVPALHYGMPEDWPQELLVIVTFEENRNKTTLTLRHMGLPAGQMIELAETGWKESFDNLAKIPE